jgi:hypothetical protein
MTTFHPHLWHDCHIWGLALHVGDPDANDWTSDLAFDIDFIVEWLCGVDGGVTFRVAPATLTFHDVTDLRVAIDCSSFEYRNALHVVALDRIEREAVEVTPAARGPYYRWRLCLNWPQGGEISFGASGYTQTLASEPIVTDQQCLTRAVRERLKVAGRPPDA